MKKMLLSFLALASFATANSQVLWSEDFSSATPPALPANWLQINGDGLTVISNLSAMNFGTLGAITYDLSGTYGKAACMTSWYSSPGTSDDWLISPAFTPTAGHYLVFDVASYEPTPYQEGYEVKISTTAGTTAAAFTTTLYSNPAENAFWTTRIIDLSAYAGQNVRIAFHDNSNDKDRIFFDNISVKTVPANSAKMNAISPLATDASAYGTVGSNKTIMCNVKNLGSSNITSYTVKYQEGANPVVSQPVTATIAPFGNSTTTFTTPYNIASLGAHNVKIWVELPGDATHSDDTLSTTLTGVSFMPARTVVLEEPTGTWCGWCVRGIVYMDSIHAAHPNDVAPISVHNGDPMVVTAYDAGVGNLVSGYPSLLVDRKEVGDPSDAFTYYTDHIGDFGFATIEQTHTLVGNALTVNAKVTPATALSGDYRLAMVVTEDDVHGTTTAYDQKNYYSSASQNITLWGNGINYQTLPATIPAAQMYYDYVARDIVGGFDGASGSLPATMVANSSYNYSFNYTIPSGSNPVAMRLIVMLIDKNGTDSKILNAKMDTFYPTGFSNLVKNNSMNVNVYPNPVSDRMFMDLVLQENLKATSYQIHDILGNLVATQTIGDLNQGTHKITINANQLATGNYTITLISDKGNFTSKFTKQ